MKNKFLVLLILVSVNLPVLSVEPEFIKNPENIVRVDFEESKKISNRDKELNELKTLLEEKAPEQLLRARKKGGGTASVPFIGTYGLNLDGYRYFLDIVDGSLDKSGKGAFTYALYNQDGYLLDNSVGVVQNYVLSFHVVFTNGAEFINIVLNPKNGYSGSGIYMLQLISDCVDNSGDGFLDINELYICQYLGPAYGAGQASLTRLSR